MRTRAEKGHRPQFFVLGFQGVRDRASPQDITRLLAAWGDGNQQALDDLLSLVYPEIRKIARQHLARQAPQTLESAALANEAYLRLIHARGIHCENRLKFFALCAQIIRRLIGEYARSQRYAKRGGSAVRVPLDEGVVGTSAREIESLALDEALESLCKIDPRKGRLVELHCLGGLTVDESAEILGISPETAKRDWKMAKAWLRVHLTGETTSQVRESPRCRQITRM
jgi:RNA polymerase sigma factor (TIGR02999 family)